MNDLVDIGANLSDERLNHDEAAVIERAGDAGISQIIHIGTQPISVQDGIDMSACYPKKVFTTAGLHPHIADQGDRKSMDLLRNLAKDPAVVAIGETGLDFYRQISPREDQERVFAAMMDIAVDNGLPLFVHVRDAHARCAEMLAERRDALSSIVVHCFTGQRDELRRYLDMDAHIGITGWICDERRGVHLQRLVAEIPLSRLMLETDSPYLLPRTMPRDERRRWLAVSGRNEPCTLPYILQTVAQHSGREAAQVARGTTATARRFFGLPAPAPASANGDGAADG